MPASSVGRRFGSDADMLVPPVRLVTPCPTMMTDAGRRFGGRAMLTDAEREKLNDLQLMLGPDAGSLALVLEQLTDAMAMVNLHAVYCRVEKGPRAGRPPLDVTEVLQTMEKAKELVQEALQRLRNQP